MKLPVRAGSKPSVPPGWAPRAAAEISPRGPRAHLPYWSPARPALLSLTPGAAGGQGILQDSLLRPLPLRASLLLPEGARPQQGGSRGAGRGGVMGGGCIGSEG